MLAESFLALDCGARLLTMKGFGISSTRQRAHSVSVSGTVTSLRSANARLVTCGSVTPQVRHAPEGVPPWVALAEVRDGKFRLVGMVRVTQTQPPLASAQHGLFTYTIQECLANLARADEVLLPAYGSAIDRGCRPVVLPYHTAHQTLKKRSIGQVVDRSNVERADQSLVSMRGTVRAARPPFT